VVRRLKDLAGRGSDKGKREREGVMGRGGRKGKGREGWVEGLPFLKS